MHISTAYSIVSEGKPKPEDSVTHICGSCATEWHDRPFTDHYSILPNEPSHVKFNKYVGHEHCHLDPDGKEYLTCPNGCLDLLKRPAVLTNMLENETPTPLERYECAVLVIELDKLEDRVKEIEYELKNHFPHVDY